MNYFFILTTLCLALTPPLHAMDTLETPKSSPPTVYKLPNMIDRDHLVKSSVMIQCGNAGATGIAIGERHILIAAHALAPYALEKQNIQCAALNSVEPHYFVPAREACGDKAESQPDIPNFSAVDLLKGVNLLREINISHVHFHHDTSFKEVDDSPQTGGIREMLEEYTWAMNYGIESNTIEEKSGVLSYFIKEGETTQTAVKTFGPDVAILECDAPHNLPSLEIADPIEDDRVLVHIIGLCGARYANENSSQLTAGTVCTLQERPTFVFIPRIIGQRFKCFPTEASGLKTWTNRPFLKVVNNQYLMEDEVSPGAPEGFGLITRGDSGAGAVVIRDGKPYIVGVASCGEIFPGFLAIHNFLAGENFNPSNIAAYTGGKELLELYNLSIKTKDRNIKWFIKQGLADVTHLKPWINSVILKK